MITSITFILDPPVGRYSSDTCARFLVKPLHPVAPSMVAPAAPAPATLRKSLRVRMRFVIPRPQIHTGKRVLRSSPEQRASSFPSTRAFLIASNQPPKIVANSVSVRRTKRGTRTGPEVGLRYARRKTITKDGYALRYGKPGRHSLTGAVLVNWLVTGGCGFIGTALIRSLIEEGGHSVRVVDNLAVGTREDLAAAGDFVEVSSDGLGPIGSGEQVELVAGDITDEDLALRAALGADVIVHFAANTGVMPSVEDPRGD